MTEQQKQNIQKEGRQNIQKAGRQSETKSKFTIPTPNWPYITDNIERLYGAWAPRSSKAALNPRVKTILYH